MLYLASQFGWFLLAGFGLGVAMGWIAQNSQNPRFWSPAWSWLAVLWCIGAALAWFQFANGMVAVWLETALLFVAVYWLGCVAGGLLGSVAFKRALAMAPLEAGTNAGTPDRTTARSHEETATRDFVASVDSSAQAKV